MAARVAQRDGELRDLLDRLRAVPLEDKDTWATVARQTAGALAAWSNAIEQTPGDLSAAAEVLSRSAQTFRRSPVPDKARSVALSGTAMLLANATHGGQGPVAQAAMIRQLLRLTQAVHDAAVATHQGRQDRTLAEDTRARLVRVREAMGRSGPPVEETLLGSGASPAPQRAPRQASELDPDAQRVLDRLHASYGDDAAAAPASPVPHMLEPRRHAPSTARSDRDRGPDAERRGRYRHGV